MNLAQKISETFIARENCIKSGNKVWEHKHSQTLEVLEKQLPSGAGFKALNFKVRTNLKITSKEK